MNDSWTVRAQQLADALAKEGSGGQLLRVERVAREFGLSPQTVQHLLRAWKFLERLRVEKPAIVGEVRALPYQGVMAMERWYARSPGQALHYLKTNPQPSVRQLIAAEKAARDLPSSGMPAEHAIDAIRSTRGPVVPGEALSRLFEWVGLEDVDLAGLNWTSEIDDYARAIGIEYAAKGMNIGILAGPVSQTTGHYSRHAKSIWYNAVCAVSLLDLVIVLLPSSAAQAACLTSMPLPPNGERGWPYWNTHSANRGQPQSGPARPASPKGGIVIFTTPEGLCEDWRK